MSFNENTIPENSSEKVADATVATVVPEDTNAKEGALSGRSPPSTSTCSNSESLSAYAEQTVAAIVHRNRTVSDFPLVPTVQTGTAAVENSPEKT